MISEKQKIAYFVGSGSEWTATILESPVEQRACIACRKNPGRKGVEHG